MQTPPPSTQPSVQSQGLETTQWMGVPHKIPVSFTEDIAISSMYEAPTTVQAQSYDNRPLMGNFDRIGRLAELEMVPVYNNPALFALDGIAPVDGIQASPNFDSTQQVDFSAGFLTDSMQPIYDQPTTLWSGEGPAFDQDIQSPIPLLSVQSRQAFSSTAETGFVDGTGPMVPNYYQPPTYWPDYTLTSGHMQAPPPLSSCQPNDFGSTQPIGSSGVSEMNHFSSEDWPHFRTKAKWATYPGAQLNISFGNDDQPQEPRKLANCFGRELELNDNNPVNSTQRLMNGVATQDRSSCGYCGVTFSRHGDRDRHISAIHFKVASYDCEYAGCSNNKGRGYCRQDKLKEHVRKLHAT